MRRRGADTFVRYGSAYAVYSQLSALREEAWFCMFRSSATLNQEEVPSCIPTRDLNVGAAM